MRSVLLSFLLLGCFSVSTAMAASPRIVNLLNTSTEVDRKSAFLYPDSPREQATRVRAGVSYSAEPETSLLRTEWALTLEVCELPSVPELLNHFLQQATLLKITSDKQSGKLRLARPKW
jgi:hypothetical protein